MRRTSRLHTLLLEVLAKKTIGIATGDAAAAAVLKWRASDGADFSHTYIPGTGAGAYPPTSAAPMASPLAAHMTPFGFAT